MGLLSLQLVAAGWHDCLLVAVSFCFVAANTWDVNYLVGLFLGFLASGRAPGKVTFSCSNELSDFDLRAACLII